MGRLEQALHCTVLLKSWEQFTWTRNSLTL